MEAQSDETMPEPRGTPPPGSGLQSAEPDPQDEFMRQTDAAELETMVRTLREPYGRAAAMYLLDVLQLYSSSSTGQWSLPCTSIKISAFLICGASRSDTRK